MKVLEINSVSNGSTGHIVINISKELSKRGHECLFAFGRGNDVKGIKTYKIGNKFSILLHVLISRLFDKSGFGSIISTKKFLKVIDDFNPDIVHIHNLHGYYINVKILFEYLKKKNIKVIWMLHDCWAYTGHCCYYSNNNCFKWKKDCNNCRFKKVYPASFFLNNSKNNFKRKQKIFSSLSSDNLTLVVPSNWLFDQVRESFLSKYKIKIFKSGIDTNIFYAKKSFDLDSATKSSNKKIILGVASVWEKRKGLDDFIKLSSIINNNEFKIVLIGITKKQKKLIPEEIQCIERTNSQKELANWYRNSFVYFNASKEETQGLTTVEAIMCGTPAIVYNFTALPEMINNKCGYVIHSVEEVVDKLNNLPKITVDVLNQYKQQFEKDECLAKYVDFICQDL